MNERVATEAIRQSTELAVDSLRPTSFGVDLRIDQAHLSVAEPSQDGSRPEIILSPELGVPESQFPRLESKVAQAMPAAPRPDIRFLNEISQLGQLAQQLHLQMQSEKDELEAREQSLRDQQSILEVEKQRFINQLANDLSSLESQKSELEKSQTSLAERQFEYDLQMRQLQTDRDLLHVQRVELDQKRQAVRSEVLLEFQAERHEFDRVKTTLREEQARVQLLKAWLQQRLDDLSAENERTLQSEREKLWQSLTTEWEQRHASFQREKEAWTKAREIEKTEIEREKALFESTVNSANVEFVTAREMLEAELSNQRELHTQQMLTERSDWEQNREREKVDFLELRQSFEEEMTELRRQHAAALQSERTAWEEFQRSEQAILQAARESLDLELKSAREALENNSRTERAEWENSFETDKAAFEAAQAEFLRERTLIESRIRFQQDHLEKSRAEFEQAQNEHRHERQVERQRIEEAGLLMIRRLRQIDLYRTSIDEREKSLDREQELFDRTQKAAANSVNLDRMSFQAEREAWEQERQIQEADVKRQKEAMANLSESLESRRTRLDKLRAELEETHRATLEMRLAVEEAWAQLTQLVGQDDARVRVEQVRESLVGYYQQMHESLEQQRREQFDALTKFERQRGEFAEERQKLTNWFAARDEELRHGEDRLRHAAAEASSNNANWLAARDRWLLEKAEAEKLIRRLLGSLGETNRDQSRDADIVFLLNDVSNSAVA